MVTNGNDKNPKKPLFFLCEKCDFTCSNKKDYKRHLSTGKHEMIINGNKNTPKNPKATMCSCGKIYKHISGLSRHKKKCNYIEEIKNEVIEVEPEVIELSNAVVEGSEEENNNPSYKEMFMTVMKENKELHKTMREMLPKIGNNNTTNNTTNNNNFNLQVFLNETCKDAINIKDFINSLSVQCSEMNEIRNVYY